MALKLPDRYSVKEVAAILGKSKSYVYTAINEGLMKARVRRGTARGYVITDADILDFIESGFIEKGEVYEGK